MPLSKLDIAITATITALIIAPCIATGVDLPADTVRYKCYVQETDRTLRIIRFYSLRGFPERFADARTIANAEIPPSVRARIRETIECVRGDLPFDSDEARALEQEQPQ